MSNNAGMFRPPQSFAAELYNNTVKRTLLCLVVVVLSVCLSSYAQQSVELGVHRLGMTDAHEYDSVDLMSNNIFLNIPVMRKAEFIPIRASAVANSSMFVSGSQWQPTMRVGSQSGGFASSLAFVVTTGTMSFAGFGWYNTPTSAGTCGGQPLYKLSNWSLLFPDGSQHYVYGGTASYTYYGNGAGCNTTQVWSTGDLSGYTVSVTGATVNYIVDKSGRAYSGIQYSIAVTDPFGNSMSEASGCGSLSCNLTDSMGLTALSASIGPSPHFDQTYSWTDINSGSPQFKVSGTTQTLKTAFGCSGITDIPSRTWQTAPTTLTLADSRTIGITYEAITGGVTGRITVITLPTSGTISYNYSGGTNGIDCNYQNAPVITRVLGNGDKTTYTLTHSQINVSGNYKAVNTVIDPGGNETDYTFTGFSATGVQAAPIAQLPTEEKRYQGQTSGTYTLLSDDVYCYNTSATSCSFSTAATATNSYPVTKRVIMHKLCVSGCSSGSPTMTSASMREEDFDGPGNVINTYDYDFGATSPTYASAITYGSCIASCRSTTPTISAITSSAGYPIADHPGQVIYYQYSGSTAYAQSYQNFTYNTNGALLSEQVSPDGGTTWVGQSTNNVFNSNGTPTNSYDLANNESDLTYSLSSYSQCGGCSSSLLPFPTQIKYPGTGNYHNLTYNGTGGVLTGITDRNSASTSLSYSSGGGADPLWRVLSVTDPLGKVCNNTYPTSSSNNSSVLCTFNSSNSVTGSITTPDAYDRTIRTQTPQLPISATYDTYSTAYSWNGNLQEVQASQPCSVAGGTDCSSLAHTFKYDPLGRLITSSTTSNETVTHTYAGQDDTSQLTPAPPGENPKEGITEYDGLGRVTQVCRYGNGVGTTCTLASGSQTGDPETYTYAATTGQTSVQITRGLQSRTTYRDGLGRVVKTLTPEGGTWNYYYDANTNCTYGGSTYGTASSGNLVCSKDPAGDLFVFYYDSQNRLTDEGPINLTASSTCRRFRYDMTTGVTGLPTGVALGSNYGRLSEAETDNCTSPITMITDEWFAYDAVGNKLNVWGSTPHSTAYYKSTATFFGNNIPATVNLNGSYTMTYTLDGEGRWNSIKDTTNNKSIVMGATFYPADTTPTISLTGTGNDTYSIDPNTGRMTQFVFTVGSSSLSGNLSWNPNGTLKQVATTDGFNAGGSMTCNFNPTSATGTGYNDWNQLVGFDCGSGNWGQTFGFDIYDNLTKTKMASRSGTTWNPGYSSSNNHCTGCTYDSNGDVTADGSYTYGYNQYSKMIWAAASGTPTCGTSGRCITYDAFGRMVESSNTSTWKEWFYTQTGTANYQSGTTLNFAYFAAPAGGTAYAAGVNSARLYFHKDWLGSARIISNNANSVTGDQSFSPYGEVMTSFGSTSNAVEFAGQTANVYKGAFYDTPNRQLSNSAGRWLSPDPAREGWNQYAYPTDPNTTVDPTGLGCKTTRCDRKYALGTDIAPDLGDPESWFYAQTGIIEGFDIFDAIAGAPGTYLTQNISGQFGFGWSEDLWAGTLNLIDSYRDRVSEQGISLPAYPTSGFQTIVQNVGDDVQYIGVLAEYQNTLAQLDYLTHLAFPYLRIGAPLPDSLANQISAAQDRYFVLWNQIIETILPGYTKNGWNP
jgi:RHS repeat-associated protein